MQSSAVKQLYQNSGGLNNSITSFLSRADIGTNLTSLHEYSKIKADVFYNDFEKSILFKQGSFGKRVVMINEDEILREITQESEKAKETKIEKQIKKDLARVKQAEKRVKEKKQKENGISTTVRFYNVDDITRLNKLKKQLAGNNVALSSYLSEMISTQLANEEKAIILKDIKNDLFYSFRKSFFASLSPFQHNIISEIENVEDEIKILNEKMDLLLQAMSGYNISQNDLDKISQHKKDLQKTREKQQHKNKKEDDNREKRLENFQAYDTKQEFDTDIYKDVIDDEILIKNKKLLLLGASAISTVPCFVSSIIFNYNTIPSGEYNISYALSQMHNNMQNTLTSFSWTFNVNKEIWNSKYFGDKWIEDLYFWFGNRGFNIDNTEVDTKYVIDNSNLSSRRYKKRMTFHQEMVDYINSGTPLSIKYDKSVVIPKFDINVIKNHISWNKFLKSIDFGSFNVYAIYTANNKTSLNPKVNIILDEIIFEYSYIDDEKYNKYKNYKIAQQYNNFVDELKNYWEKSLTVITDTGGDIETELKKGSEKSLKSNWEYLNDEVDRVNNKIRSKIAKQMRLNKDDIVNLSMGKVDGSHINLYLSSPWSNYMIYKNLKVNFAPSEYFKSQEVDKRLTIDLGKWVDFETGTTELVDDKLIRVPNDKEIKCKGKKCYLGKYEVHTPLKVSFTTLNENEVLKINGKRIDVLDKFFSEELKDNRSSANDTEREFDSGVETTNINGEEVAKTEENSHSKNEYKIEILTYNGKGNLDENLVKHYKKILVINSRSIQEDFKWYAWNPNENYHQKVLISPYKIDEDGNEIKDEKGNKIPNELYDASIDANTGTKKQLIWVDSKGFQFYEENYNEDEEYTASWYNAYKTDDKQATYYSDTYLPLGAKTLFKPNLKDAGFIAEAVVLGKGGLKSYIGKTKDVKIFKILTDMEDALAYNTNYYDDTNQNSENNYISTSGLYLIVQNGENTISNFKFVLIDDKTSPQSFFTDNVSNAYLIPFWNSKIGAEMYNFISEKYQLKDDVIFSLKYEDIMEYYKLFMNAVYNNEKFNSYIAISPLLKGYKQLTKEEFTEKFADGDSWKFNDIKKYFFDDFKGANYVEIDKISFDGNNAVKLHLKLNSYNINHKLSAEEITIPLKINGEDKQVINISWNAEYINTTLKETWSFEEFKNKITSNTQMWLNDFKHYDKVTLSANWDNNFMRLNVALKEEFLKEYSLSGASSFLIDITEKWNKQKQINTKDIFSNYADLKINLKGENNVEKIKDTIKKQVINHFNSLILGVDYDIANLDAVANERKFVELEIDGNKGKKYSNLELIAKQGKNGRRLVKIYNSVPNILSQEVDLSKIKLQEVQLQNSDNTTMLKELYEKINTQLTQYNITIPRDLSFTWNEDLMLAILKRKGSFKAEIKGKNALIKNSTIINITTQVKADEKVLIDLSLLSDMEEIQLSENKLSVLKDKLINRIKTYLFEKFYLIQNKDYKFDWNAINSAIREVAKSDNIKHSGYVNIYAVENVSQGTKAFKFSNKTNKEIEDDLVDIIDLSKIQDWDNHSYSFNSMSALRNAVINDLIAYLKTQNLNIYKDYTLDFNELNNTIKQVLKADGIKHSGYITIYGVNNISDGNKSFEFSNTNDKEVIDDLDKEIIIKTTEKLKDLSVIKGASFLYSQNDLEALKTAFVSDLDKYLNNVYGLKYNADYELNADELNEAIRGIAKSDGKLHSTSIKLYPLGESKNNGYVFLSNHTNKDIIDNLTNGINNPNNKKSIAQKVVWFIGIPLGILAVGASSLLGWFIYMRKYRNKVK
ncbi:Mbov_0399 family ICE element protein [Mycoplasma seminis]|uniref:Uncharacterized protein n=1 Tax=Mycoplasma seminis TaxID=512749 RepID=A0ABY9H9W3_9MOLU|nr:hypothetical protein [Mycoplasma seminis]WLP85206.1 hypothetical protein Q8852_02695 [Mycoplasma seminis]